MCKVLGGRDVYDFRREVCVGFWEKGVCKIFGWSCVYDFRREVCTRFWDEIVATKHLLHCGAGGRTMR